jgi:hypothetical protein
MVRSRAESRPLSSSRPHRRRVVLLYALSLDGTLPAGELSGEDVIVITPSCLHRRRSTCCSGFRQRPDQDLLCTLLFLAELAGGEVALDYCSERGGFAWRLLVIGLSAFVTGLGVLRFLYLATVGNNAVIPATSSGYWH